MDRPTLISSLLLPGLLLTAVPSNLYGQTPGQTDADILRSRAARLYVRGLTKLRDGNHEAAIELFTQASHEAPGQAAIFLSLSEAHEALAQHDVALFYAEQAVRLSKEAPYLHHLAKTYLRADQAEKAADVYDELLEAPDVDTDAVFEAARLKVHLGRDSEAAAAFERLIRMVGDDRILRTQLLQLYGRLDDVVGVERTLQALIRLQPSSEQYYLLLSDFHQRRGNVSDAIDVLEHGLRTADDAYDIASELVALYREQGRNSSADSLAATLTDVANLSEDELARRAEKAYLRATKDPSSSDTAVSLLEQALATAPDDLSLLIMLGDLHFLHGDYSEAAPLLSRALQKDVRNSDLWLQTALAHLNSGSPADAARTAEEATILFPGNVQFLIVAGHANTQLYQNSRAIELFSKALDLLADETLWDSRLASESHAALGFLFSRRKNVDESDIHYAQAIRIDSTNSFALNNFAYSLAERGIRLDEARDMAMRALELDPDNAAFLDTAGWIYFQLRKYDLAYESIAKAVDTGRASATVHLHLGDVQSARGNVSEARSSWEKGLALDPDNAELKKRLGLDAP